MSFRLTNSLAPNNIRRSLNDPMENEVVNIPIDGACTDVIRMFADERGIPVDQAIALILQEWALAHRSAREARAELDRID